jgi:hypothetical protein
LIMIGINDIGWPGGVRQAVNKWIRESKELDGVIDFDALARDPERPSHILSPF